MFFLVPFTFQNEGITNGFSQNNDIPCSTDVVRASDKELKSFCSKLTCANGYNGKKDIKRIPGEHQVPDLCYGYLFPKSYLIYILIVTTSAMFLFLFNMLVAVSENCS